MTPDTKAIPKGHHAVTPYMITKGAVDAITFYKKAFGATELMRLTDDSGKVRHAEIKIGDSPIMIVDEFPEYPIMQSPQSLGGATMHIFLYVEDVDAIFAQAIDAGAKELEPVEEHSEGDRRGGIMDPFGHIWWIATHVKDVPLEEL
ncbi:VOC family protein [Virgibacillus dakarensis]|uniref:Glyoxalase n=1 Tax=Lentibacillus populi TaxID=1827502 RepID=A0A9W5TZN0_9BACI|nr:MULTISPECIES: VOC family protein [Bacillaceae]MBT2218656.1 VOC family protein [Virgibacillus dakarensis]MTW88368.1 VOC family protein [Virgibacillus dakarensis]GGB49798.1 glyoxalase [Lentibacillus populi]